MTRVSSTVTVEEGHLGCLYEAQVADGLIPVSGFAGLLGHWQQQPDEHRDDRDNHQQLDQGEPIPARPIAQNIPLCIQHDFLLLAFVSVSKYSARGCGID